MDMNEIYLEKYIGEREYSRFAHRWKACRKWGFGFSFLALIFGPLYLFHKKMYREGAAFMVLMLTVSLIAGTAAGIFAMGYDGPKYPGHGREPEPKRGFSYSELTPGEIYSELTAPPVYVAVYWDRRTFSSDLTVSGSPLTVIMPLVDRHFYYVIDSFPAYVFWKTRLITNVVLCLLLALRFDVIYYRKMSGLAAGQLSGIKEGAPEGSRLKVMERAYGEKPCHPLYVLMALTFLGVLYPLPLPFFPAVFKGAAGLLLFPVISAADYIFGDKNVRFD